MKCSTVISKVSVLLASYLAKLYVVVKIKLNINYILLHRSMKKYILKTVNYLKLLKWSLSCLEMGSRPIQQLKKYTIFRKKWGHYIYIYKCTETCAKIINSYFTKWCTIKFIMIWSCRWRCCAESSGTEMGHPYYNHKACSAVVKQEV